MKQKFYVIMAILAGLIFAFSLFFYLRTVNSSSSALKPLVVSVQDIQARSVVQPGQLEIKKVPQEGYPQGGFSSVEDVAGKILLVSVGKGDVLVAPMLESNYKAGSAPVTGAAGGGSLAVPGGKRAVAIPVTEVGSVAFNVQPGDRIDILVTMDIKFADGNSKTITSLAAQDVLVLNTGTAAPAKNEKTSPATSYVLALDVPQAMAVTLGSEKGTLRLLLRNPGNKEQLTQAPIDPSVYLLPDYFTRFK